MTYEELEVENDDGDDFFRDIRGESLHQDKGGPDFGVKAQQ